MASDLSTARSPGGGGLKGEGRMSVGTCRRIQSSLRRALCCTSVQLVEETTTAGKGRVTAGVNIRGSFRARQSSEGTFSLIYLLALVDISADAARMGAGGRWFRQPHGDTSPRSATAGTPRVPQDVNVATLLLRSLTRPLGVPGTFGCARGPAHGANHHRYRGPRRAEQGRRRAIGATARGRAAPTTG